jgi:exodeoxyribonuclease-5
MTVKSEFDDKRQVSIAVPQQHFTNKSTTDVFDPNKRHDAFTFGNVLTVHRAQGSEWKSIVLFDESDSFREDKSRWLYTGITRASQNIVVVRP